MSTGARPPAAQPGQDPGAGAATAAEPRRRPTATARGATGPHAGWAGLGHMQRHPGDVLRVLAGGLVVAAGGMAARHGHVFAFDANLFRLVNQLPGALGRPLLAVMQVGALAAVPVVAAVALIARRPRLARDLALSGGLAWVLAKLVKDLVGEARPVALLHGVVQRTVDTGFGYPSGHVAVAAAQHDHGSPPEVVAEAVVHALTTPQPRAHYLVSKNSRRMAVLAAALPTPVLDRLRRRQAHQPAPGSRVSAAAGAQAAVGGRERQRRPRAGGGPMKALVPHHSRFTQQQMGPSASATETVMRQLYERRSN